MDPDKLQDNSTVILIILIQLSSFWFFKKVE